MTPGYACVAVTQNGRDKAKDRQIMDKDHDSREKERERERELGSGRRWLAASACVASCDFPSTQSPPLTKTQFTFLL